MIKAQGGLSRDSLFFCSFLLLVSTLLGVTSTPAYGQGPVQRLPPCDTDIRCLGLKVVEVELSVGLDPWQEVLRLWKQCHQRLSVDKTAGHLSKFFNQGDKLLNHQDRTEFDAVNMKERQAFVEEIQALQKELAPEGKGKPPKSVRSLIDLEKAINVVRPEVSIDSLKNKRK